MERWRLQKSTRWCLDDASMTYDITDLTMITRDGCRWFLKWLQRAEWTSDSESAVSILISSSYQITSMVGHVHVQRGNKVLFAEDWPGAINASQVTGRMSSSSKSLQLHSDCRCYSSGFWRSYQYVCMIHECKKILTSRFYLLEDVLKEISTAHARSRQKTNGWKPIATVESKRFISSQS